MTPAGPPGNTPRYQELVQEWPSYAAWATDR
jgi:hypothetical protein